MKKFTIILIVLVTMTIKTNAQIPLIIPTATITLDGDTSDWTGITEAVTDPQGDDSNLYTGDDIEALYLAKDFNNLYIRLDLYDNANPNFGNGPAPYEGRYYFQIYSNSSTYSNLEIGLASYYCGQQWAIGCNGANGNAPSSLQGTSFVGVNNNIIEIKIPLIDIANPTDFYQVDAIVNNCCVSNGVTLDSCSVGSLSTGILSVISNPLTNSFYPNPASEFITFSTDINNKSDLILNIYNLIGEQVKSELLKQNQQKINLRDLINGVYLVEIKSKEWSAKQKLTIQK